jgi:hypothetical protein
MRFPNAFYDPSLANAPWNPANPGEANPYYWHMNHQEEEETGAIIGMERTAPVGGVGLVRQQGEEEPMILRMTGTILDPLQDLAFKSWRSRCMSRTIRYQDFSGDEFEVVITRYQPRRERVMNNMRATPGTPESLYIIRYTLEMDVIQVLAGSWA